MKEIRFEGYFSLGIRYIFHLFPDVEFDWKTISGTTTISWFWFYIRFVHTNTAIANSEHEVHNL